MLKIENLTKEFGSFGLRNVSVSVASDDYFVLLGESGAGKSLLLEMIAGLQRPDSGNIWLNNKNITKYKIQDRPVGLVMQDYAVFPHMTVYNNIAYPLRRRKLKSGTIVKQIKSIAGRLSILHLLDRKTTSLSGGELQRVALARTLASNPDVLLLDEPLTSLDAKIKKEIRILLREIHKGGIPVIHVTHDYEEAIMLATRIAIIHNGTIIQTGTPLDIFNRPQNDFIANLAGISNFFPATLLPADKKSRLRTARANGLEIKLFCDLSNCNGYIIIPPEQIIISPSRTETSTQNNFYGKITDVYLSAYGYTVTVDIGFKLYVFITVSSFEKLKLKSGMNIWISFKAGAVRFIESDSNKR